MPGFCFCSWLPRGAGQREKAFISAKTCEINLLVTGFDGVSIPDRFFNYFSDSFYGASKWCRSEEVASWVV